MIKKIILCIIIVTTLLGGIEDLLCVARGNKYPQFFWITSTLCGAVGSVVCLKNARNAYIQMLQTLNMDTGINHSYSTVFKEMGKLSEKEAQSVALSGINELGFLLSLAIFTYCSRELMLISTGVVF